DPRMDIKGAPDRNGRWPWWKIRWIKLWTTGTMDLAFENVRSGRLGPLSLDADRICQGHIIHDLKSPDAGAIGKFKDPLAGITGIRDRNDFCFSAGHETTRKTFRIEFHL